MAAQPGSVVEVAGGNYPTQTMNFDPSKESASSRVVFNLDASAQVAGESTLWGVQHVEFRGGQWTKVTVKPSDSQGLVPGAKLAKNVVISGSKLKSFLIRNGQQITIRDSQIGSFDVSTDLGVPKVGAYPPENGAAAQPSRDIVLERLSFRDITRPRREPARRMPVRRRRHRAHQRPSLDLHELRVFDIFAEPRGGLVSDLVIEGNMLDTPRDGVRVRPRSAISSRVDRSGTWRSAGTRSSGTFAPTPTPRTGDRPGPLSFLGNAWKNSGCASGQAEPSSLTSLLSAADRAMFRGAPGFISARDRPVQPFLVLPKRLPSRIGSARDRQGHELSPLGRHRRPIAAAGRRPGRGSRRALLTLPRASGLRSLAGQQGRGSAPSRRTQDAVVTREDRLDVGFPERIETRSGPDVAPPSPPRRSGDPSRVSASARRERTGGFHLEASWSA